MAASRPDILLFDLGGVLIDNVAFDRLPELLPEPMERAALIDRWMDSAAVGRFERGEIGTAAFGEAFVAEWALALSPADFLAHFEAWPRGPYPGALDLLDRLKGDFVLGVLSNCNELHWRRFPEVLSRIDYPFSSHELGLLKPDPAIFERVAALMGAAPERVLFLDDSARNVAAARSVGMRADQVMGIAEVERVLNPLRQGGP